MKLTTKKRNVSGLLLRQLAWSRTMLYGMALPVLAFSFSTIGTSVWRYLLMAIGFSLIIFVHELGHFMVARWCSVKCEVFSIGIGHRLLGWKKGRGLSFGPEKETADPRTGEDVTGETGAAGAGTLHDLPQTSVDPDAKHHGKFVLTGQTPSGADIGETDYRISILPLGGYVKMLGQDDMDATKVSEDPRSFNRRPIWQRMCIVSAGVVMNIIFAFIVFVFVFHRGLAFPPAIIGAVQFDSPAERAGFLVGDKIVAIDGEGPVPDEATAFLEFTDVKIASALARDGDKITFTVERDGKRFPITVKPLINKETGMLQVGLAPSDSLDLMKFVDDDDPKVARMVKELQSQPQYSKLKSEDRLVKVGETSVTDYAALYRLIQASRGGALAFTFQSKDGTSHTDAIYPKLMRRLGVDLNAMPSIAGFYPRTRIETIEPDQAAEKSGLTEGKIIRACVPRNYPTNNQLVDIIRRGGELAIMVEGDPVVHTVKPEIVDKVMHIGVGLDYDWDTTVIAAVDENNPALAQIRPLSSVQTLNDEPVKSWLDIWNKLADFTRASPGKGAVFGIQPEGGGEIIKIEVKLPVPPSPDQIEKQGGGAPPAGELSAAPEEAYVSDLRKLEFETRLPFVLLNQNQHSPGLWNAGIMGYDHTRKFVIQTYSTLRGLFKGTVPPGELHGALGIGKLGADVQKRDDGFMYLIYLLGVVSVNLAVANFLPLPIVDGGLFILLIVEKIRGQPLPMKIQNAIQVAGLILLGSLFLFVTYNDLKLFGN